MEPLFLTSFQSFGINEAGYRGIQVGSTIHAPWFQGTTAFTAAIDYEQLGAGVSSTILVERLNRYFARLGIMVPGKLVADFAAFSRCHDLHVHDSLIFKVSLAPSG